MERRRYRFGALVLGMVRIAASILIPSVALCGPTITVSPASGLFDDPFSVRVQGVVPGAVVKLRASLTDDLGKHWASEGTYYADAWGVVDAVTAASVDGTYLGTSAHSLWCSMLPFPKSELARVLQDPPVGLRAGPAFSVSGAYSVEVAALSDGEDIAPITVERRIAAPGIAGETVRSGRIRGMYFASPESMQGQPVLVISGSNGGLSPRQSAMLASRGHPALSIAYFAYEDLPKEQVRIPLEIFRDGAAWLKKKTGWPTVAVMGTSTGTEAAVLAAASFPNDIQNVIVYAPSSIVNEGFPSGVPWAHGIPGWTLAGRDIPFYVMSAEENRRYDADVVGGGKSFPGFVGTPYYLKPWSDPEVNRRFGLPVERIRGRLLALAGADDAIWPSGVGARQLEARMARYGRNGDVIARVFEGVGHGISGVGAGNELSAGYLHPVTKTFVAFGGLPQQTCDASYSAWESLLTFLADTATGAGTVP